MNNDEDFQAAKDWQYLVDQAEADLIAKHGEAEFSRMQRIAWEALLRGDPNPTFVPWADESEWETKP